MVRPRCTSPHSNLLQRIGPAFGLVLSFWIFLFPSYSLSQIISSDSSPRGSGASSSSSRSEIGFASQQKLKNHYHKHGREFGKISQGEYLRLAQELRDRPRDGSILEAKRTDGVVTRFDRKNGAFIAFNPDGLIRTFFRPNDGEAYFWRQTRRIQKN